LLGALAGGALAAGAAGGGAVGAPDASGEWNTGRVGCAPGVENPAGCSYSC